MNSNEFLPPTLTLPVFQDGVDSYLRGLDPNELLYIFSPRLEECPYHAAHPPGRKGKEGVYFINQADLHKDFLGSGSCKVLYPDPESTDFDWDKIRLIRPDYTERRDNVTSLMCAGYLGDVNALQTLIHSGAYVDKQVMNGNSVLMETVMGCDGERRNECVRRLLNAGARINLQNTDGHTAMTAAAYVGDVEVARTLAKKKPDINHKTKCGSTALTMAVAGNHPEMVHFLVTRCGADILVEDHAWLTALGWGHVTSLCCSGYLTVQLGLQRKLDEYLKRRLELLERSPDNILILTELYMVSMMMTTMMPARLALLNNRVLEKLTTCVLWREEMEGEQWADSMDINFMKALPWVIALGCSMLYDEDQTLNRFLQCEAADHFLETINDILPGEQEEDFYCIQALLTPILAFQEGRAWITQHAFRYSKMLDHFADEEGRMAKRNEVYEAYKEMMESHFDMYELKVTRDLLGAAKLKLVCPSRPRGLRDTIGRALKHFPDLQQKAANKLADKNMVELIQQEEKEQQQKRRKRNTRKNRRRKNEERNLGKTSTLYSDILTGQARPAAKGKTVHPKSEKKCHQKSEQDRSNEKPAFNLMEAGLLEEGTIARNKGGKPLVCSRNVVLVTGQTEDCDEEIAHRMQMGLDVPEEDFVVNITRKKKKQGQTGGPQVKGPASQLQYEAKGKARLVLPHGEEPNKKETVLTKEKYKCPMKIKAPSEAVIDKYKATTRNTQPEAPLKPVFQPTKVKNVWFRTPPACVPVEVEKIPVPVDIPEDEDITMEETTTEEPPKQMVQTLDTRQLIEDPSKPNGTVQLNEKEDIPYANCPFHLGTTDDIGEKPLKVRKGVILLEALEKEVMGDLEAVDKPTGNEEAPHVQEKVSPVTPPKKDSDSGNDSPPLNPVPMAHVTPMMRQQFDSIWDLPATNSTVKDTPPVNNPLGGTLKVDSATRGDDVSNLPRLREQFDCSPRWSPLFGRLLAMPPMHMRKVGPINFCTSDPNLLLAKGNNGTLVTIGLLDNGMEVAVKRLLNTSRISIQNELHTIKMPQLQHSTIIKCKEYVEDNDFGYLALELCEFTLEEYVAIHRQQGSLHLHQRRLVEQLLMGLEVLHAARVLHTNLQPRNILIDRNGDLRLASLGQSCHLVENQDIALKDPVDQGNVPGVRCWQSRESLLSNFPGMRVPYTAASDMQVAGMIIHYILTGGIHPYGDDPIACEINIRCGTPYRLASLDDVIMHFLCWMLHSDMDMRKSATKCLTHPFFWNDEKRNGFIHAVCREPEIWNSGYSEVGNTLNNAKHWLGVHDWHSKVSKELLIYQMNRHPYSSEVTDLLRFITHLHEHFPDLPQSLKAEVQDPYQYFQERWPHVMIAVYDVIINSEWCKRPPLSHCQDKIKQPIN